MEESLEERWRKFQEKADKEAKEEAVKVVDKMDPEYLKDVSPVVELSRAIHAGTNYFGDRLTPEEIEVLEKTYKALRQEVADKYFQGKILDVGIKGDRFITDEVLKRYHYRKERDGD